MLSPKWLCFLASVAVVSAFDPWSGPAEVENRTIDEIYQAALAEGGVVTLWHGGDEKDQQDSLKQAFEARFPGITLNVTVDLSKYHDVKIDRQIASGNVEVDTVALQTLHDYPRWKSQGVLRAYKPLGWDQVYNDFKDADGYYTGILIFNWANIWNTEFVDADCAPHEFSDFLKPVFKDKLVLTYPNDDDAVLFAFDLILKNRGTAWFDALLAQNPRWVRGTATPATLVASSNGTYVATFTSAVGLKPSAPFNISLPSGATGQFVAWPQTAAILKDAPHPEGAKLLHNFLISAEHQEATGFWPVRRDVAPPAGVPALFDVVGTDATKFSEWMADRAAVERLRFFFEDKIGTAQGLSPLEDDL